MLLPVSPYPQWWNSVWQQFYLSSCKPVGPMNLSSMPPIMFVHDSIFFRLLFVHWLLIVLCTVASEQACHSAACLFYCSTVDGDQRTRGLSIWVDILETFLRMFLEILSCVIKVLKYFFYPSSQWLSLHFYAQKQLLLSAHLSHCNSVCLSVCLVCHMGGSVKNGAS